MMNRRKPGSEYTAERLPDGSGKPGKAGLQRTAGTIGDQGDTAESPKK